MNYRQENDPELIRAAKAAYAEAPPAKTGNRSVFAYDLRRATNAAKPTLPARDVPRGDAAAAA
jgi:hypothetical protein